MGPKFSSFTVAVVAAAIVTQCEDVVKRHEAATLEEYVDDCAFRALVSEMLDIKEWAKEKKELWMRDASQMIYLLYRWSLRECHRLWQSFLRQSIDIAAAGSSERASVSLQLLVSRCLVRRGVLGVGEANADGESVLVQAGGDGWTAMEIYSAAAAGADVDAVDGSGHTCVWNAACYGHNESIAALLEVKGDLHKCNNRGQSPLHISAQNGHLEICRLLLQCNADLEAKDHE